MSSKGNVLLIDDNPARAKALADTLMGAGYSVNVENDCLSTDFELGGESELDVILCELNMQDLSWSEARYALSRMDVQVPAILLSDTADAELMTTALRLGASDLFLRPLDDEKALFKSIDRCIRQRSMGRELRESRQHLEAANLELRATVQVLEQDQQAGRQVQMRMLPSTPLTLGDYEFSHKVIPSLYLSGDFTDYFTVGDHHVAFVMADVSGHGSSSAFTTVLLKNIFARKRSDLLRRNDHSIMDPLAMLQRANQELLELGVDKFATMVIGVLDLKNNFLRYSIAGHLPLPVLVSPEGAEFLQGEGPAVGMMDEVQHVVYERKMPERFTLAMFSDGILEILPPDNLLDKEAHLLSLFGPAGQSHDSLVSDLGLDQVRDAPDDIAALFLRKHD